MTDESAQEPAWETYWYEKNLQGDITGIYNSQGELVKSYVYDAWGGIILDYNNTAERVSNSLLYRGYYYDSDLGFYYLHTRYYDPVVRRFLSPDSFDVIAASPTQLTDKNLFSYCDNNPVTRADYGGEFWESVFEFFKNAANEIGKAFSTLTPAYAGFGGAVVSDGPLPVGDVIGAVGIVLITVGAIGYGIYSAIDSSKTEDLLKTPPKNQAYFTTNPYDFNPRGLVMTEYSGTKNGKIIKWKDPNTNTTIFEWNEDLKYGAHYHILADGNHTGDHILPNTPVPEPWNSLYFGDIR